MKNEPSKKRRWLRAAGGVLAGVLVLVLVVPLLAFNISPVAGSLLIRAMFAGEPQLPPASLTFTGEVQVQQNLRYGTAADEQLDLYLPKQQSGTCPLVIWVHGGAFVGGDKNDVRFLAEALAFNGYAVAAINYSRAPEAKYPTPVLQTGRAYSFLTTGSYPGKEKIDTRQIFIAGDSAGANIAAQFALLQTNMAYRAAFMSAYDAGDFPGVMPPEVLRGALLYCGPYSMGQLGAVSHPLMKFLLSQTGWAYFGERDFAAGPAAAEVDIIRHVTAAFPPAFITDGNTLSFPDHGKALSGALSALGVPVRNLFFDDTAEAVPHEYQFHLQSEAGRTALEHTLQFLADYRLPQDA